MAAQKRGRTTRRRGRLPQRVYWVRRTVVLVVAAALVFGFGKLLGGLGSDQTPDRANTVASTPSASASASGGATQAPMGPAVPSALTPGASGGPLPSPTGPCSADEVSVAPSVPVAQAGRPIVILLRLQGTQPACTFAVSPQSLVLKVTSGADRIWSSQDCPTAIPRTTVVVRSGTPAEVPVTWNGRRSDTGCTSASSWAMPGFYHLLAAAIGSAPSDVQFEVTYPKRGIVTKTAKPRPRASASASPAPTTSSKTATPTKAPRPSPSASVSGKGSKCGGDNAAGSC